MLSLLTVRKNHLTLALFGLVLCHVPTLQASPIDLRKAEITKTDEIPESPANAEFRKGVDATLKGKNALAKEHFIAALKFDPKFAPALIGLADLAQRKRDFGQAEKFLKQAKNAAPRTAAVHLAWGRFHLAGHRPDQAEASFKLARELNPHAIAPLLELGNLFLADPARRADAAKVYAAAVELAPDNATALQSLGIVSALLGKRQDALNSFERASTVAAKDPVPLQAIGRLYLEDGDWKKALAAFDRGLQRQPKFVPLMLDRSDALVGMNNRSAAIKQVMTAARLAPKSAPVYIKLGDIYQGATQWDEARTTYAKAIALDAKNPFAHNNLAWALIQQGNSQKEAVAAAKKAVSLAPNSAPFLDTLGLAQRAVGDLPAAAESLKRATDIEPKHGEFQLHYGTVLIELKRIADARQALTRAIDSKFSQANEAQKLLDSLQSN